MLNAEKVVKGLAQAKRQIRRLGLNQHGYLGQRIDINKVLKSCVRAARTHGWQVEKLEIRPGIIVPVMVRQKAAGASEEPSWERPKIYLSTGIHGDEPAGPLAVQQLLDENCWPQHLSLWLCPCVNPTGFAVNRRENAEGIDLNRDYRESKSSEVLAHKRWLAGQPDFSLCLCIHEDWESGGFYVYELNPENRKSLAESIVRNAARLCPIDTSELIEGRPAQGGIIRPHLDPRSRPDWPEAFYLITHKTRLSYTLEAPSDFPLAVRVAALRAGILGALEQIR